MAPGTPVVRTVNAEMDTVFLFPPELTNSRKQHRFSNVESPPHDHETFEAEEIAVEAEVEPESLAERLRQLGALRIKGFVQTSNGVRLVQGVGPRVDLLVPPILPPSDLLGRIVVIRRSQRSGYTH